MSPPLPVNASTTELKPILRPEWNRYVAGRADALLFHSWDWLELLARVYEIDWHAFGIWNGDDMIGIFPLLTRTLPPFRLAGSPLTHVTASTPFMGPLVTSEQIPAVLTGLEPVLHALKIDHVEISFPARLTDTTFAGEAGYVGEICQAVALPLANRSREDLWRGLVGSCRRAIRKAEKNGVTVEIADNISFLDVYYQMYQEVYRSSGRLPHLSKEFYAIVWKTLGSQKIRVLLAKHAGEVLAGGIFLLHQKTAYYLSGASFDNGLHWRPNNLIQWRFIEWAAERGFECYDLGGAVVPGITRFKLSFGGAIYPFTRLHRANSKLARLGREVYKHAIPLWRKLYASRSRQASPPFSVWKGNKR